MLLGGGSSVVNELMTKYGEKKYEKDNAIFKGLDLFRFRGINEINAYYENNDIKDGSKLDPKDGDGKISSKIDDDLRSMLKEEYKKRNINIKKPENANPNNDNPDKAANTDIDDDILNKDIEFIKNEIDVRKGIESYVDQIIFDAKKDPSSKSANAILSKSPSDSNAIKDMILEKFPNIDISNKVIDKIIDGKIKKIKDVQSDIKSKADSGSEDLNSWEPKHYAILVLAIVISSICPLAGIIIFSKLPPINPGDSIYQKIKNSSPYSNRVVESMENNDKKIKSKPWGSDLIDNLYTKRDDIIKNAENKEEFDKIINDCKKPILEKMKSDGKEDKDLDKISKEMDSIIDKMNVKQSINSESIEGFKENSMKILSDNKVIELNAKYENDPNKDAKIKEGMDKFTSKINTIMEYDYVDKKTQPESNIDNKESKSQEVSSPDGISNHVAKDIGSKKNNDELSEIGSHTQNFIKAKNEEKSIGR